MPDVLDARIPLHLEYTPQWMSAEDCAFIEEAVFSRYDTILRLERGLHPLTREEMRGLNRQIDILAL